MKRIKTLITIIVSLSFTLLNAQEFSIDNGYELKSFLIIHSSKDYQSALKKAKVASKELDLKLDLRNYYYKENVGLVTDSLCGCGENHGYIARGRFDDGNYISIEFSDDYNGFSKGYFIVVIASNTKDNEDLPKTLELAKNKYKSAYIKSAPVYVSCMH